MLPCSRRASSLAFRLHQQRLFSSNPRLPSSISKMSGDTAGAAKEGKVTATQADIDTRQEELDAEMQDVSL